MNKPEELKPIAILYSQIVEANGKTIRENNMAIKHKYPIGQVVIWHIKDEYNFNIEHTDKEICLGLLAGSKLKLIVVHHLRDCDGTPLYMLSAKPIGYIGKEGTTLVEHITYKKWVDFMVHCISEDGITPCEGEVVKLRYDSIFDYEEMMRKEFGNV